MTRAARAPWPALPKAVLDALLPKPQVPPKATGVKRRHSTSSLSGKAESSKAHIFRELDSCSTCGHPTNTAHDNIITRKGLGRTNTEPNQWRRGMIVRVPHLVPTLGEVLNDECRVWSKNVGNICPKIRYAVVVAVYCTRMIVLPILSAQGHRTTHKSATYKVTAMLVLPKMKSRMAQKVSDNTLYMSGEWEPKEGSHINLNEPMTVYYAWPLECTDQLEPRSTALLQQRYRIAHNMAFVPLFAQESYFKSQITREPILCPLPDGAPADEYYVSEAHRPSVASENENLLVHDLGYGIHPEQHDSKADRVLIRWKPSLEYILGSTTDFPYHDVTDVWEVPAVEGKNPGFDYYPYDHIKDKKEAANRGSDRSDQVSPRTVKLQNERWQCLHDCADKKKCKHSCCKNGVKRKPRTTTPEKVESPKKRASRITKTMLKKSSKQSKRPTRKCADSDGSNVGRGKRQRLNKAQAGARLK